MPYEPLTLDHAHRQHFPHQVTRPSKLPSWGRIFYSGIQPLGLTKLHKWAAQSLNTVRTFSQIWGIYWWMWSVHLGRQFFWWQPYIRPNCRIYKAPVNFVDVKYMILMIWNGAILWISSIMMPALWFAKSNSKHSASEACWENMWAIWAIFFTHIFFTRGNQLLHCILGLSVWVEN